MSQLKGSGRIYLFSVGPHTQPYRLKDLAAWLHASYHLEVATLPPIAADPTAWNRSRGQITAELLLRRIKQAQAALAADPQAYLIGFTDAPMYTAGESWSSSFTQRDEQRAAIISAAGLEDSFWERWRLDKAEADRHLGVRVQRILLKDVATLYWHLPLNYDPVSVLRQPLDPDLQRADLYVSDLNPEATVWGRAEREPCVVLHYTRGGDLRPLPGDLIRTCASVKAATEDDGELFTLNLRLGQLTSRHTDFYLPDTTPIVLERVTRSDWGQSMALGGATSHTYEKYLWSQGMRQIDVVGAEGIADKLRRVPSWLPIVPWAKWVDADTSGDRLALRWSVTPRPHFDLARFDGALEAYLPCDNNVRCYIDGYRAPEGGELRFTRDEKRRLVELRSPHGRALRFSYDDVDRIRSIAAGDLRRVEYRYDEAGRLATVIYPHGETLQYEYDSFAHLLTFSAGAGGMGGARVLMRNTYDHGMLVSQALADGTTFRYTYNTGFAAGMSMARVHASDGKAYDVAMRDEDSAIRLERQP